LTETDEENIQAQVRKNNRTEKNRWRCSTLRLIVKDGKVGKDICCVRWNKEDGYIVLGSVHHRKRPVR